MNGLVRPLYAFAALPEPRDGNVWDRGKGTTLEVLAPAFNDDGLEAAAEQSKQTGVPVCLYVGADDRLTIEQTGAVVARLIERGSDERIVVQLA